MVRAIELAAESALSEKAGGVFGAVVVDQDGRCLGESAGRVLAENDPTSHAEIQAIRNACRKVATFRLDGCTLYTSGECCPMCAAAAYWAGIGRIVFAATCGDALEYGDFEDSMIFSELKKPTIERSIPAQQIMREECVAVWKKYHAMRGRARR